MIILFIIKRFLNWICSKFFLYFSSFQPLFLNNVIVRSTDSENNQDDTTFFVCYLDGERIHFRTSTTEKYVIASHIIYISSNLCNQIIWVN